MSPNDNFISKIKELNNPNVHIKDKNRVNTILKGIIEGGTKRLQVVSDFDRTITKQHEDGKTHISSFGIFSHCPSVTEEYLKTENSLFKKYFPYEVDVSIPDAEKRKLMEEWWSLSQDALRGLTVSQQEILETAAKLTPLVRDGTEQLLEDLYKAEVPVLVFSAGLGDTVVAVLKNFNVLFPNVKVISNFLKYDDDGVIQGFQSATIHLLNKNELALEGTEYHELIENRDNVILMGDSIGDAGMADGVRHANAILKIGFLYGDIEKNLPVFMDTFDVVLEDDQTMDVIKAIFKNILIC